ncbi:barstar family protein [Planobispora rosea]|uniref:barstar family protein n=1 Tax=Planobispora rosea TaxID=35762 RepID=UPI00159F00F4|nr:barstar family protein [Planobispora rosea]
MLKFADMENFFVGDRSFCEDLECPDETPNYRLSVPVYGVKASFDRKWGFDEPLVISGDVELEILDRSGRSIGGYDLWNVEIILASPDGCAGEFRATASWLPRVSAKPVWELWRVAPPGKVNQWWDIPIGQREGWVEVAQNSRISTRLIGEEILLDGRGVVDLASFFCAIGEAVHGPGGYFGSNFMALSDCLRRLPRKECSPMRVRWLDYAVAEEHLSKSIDTDEGSVRYVDLIVEVFSDAGISVVFE